MGITTEEILVNLRLQMKGFTTGMKNAEKSVDAFRGRAIRLGMAVGKLKNSFKGLVNSMKSFRMELLGIMFGGMLIMRTFQNLIRTTVTTFMKISQGATEVGNKMTALSAEFTFLKFTVGRAIGEALAPLIPKIISLIRAFGAFSREHPKFVGAFVLIGTVVGTLLFLFGSLNLLIGSLVQFFTGPLFAAMAGIIQAGFIALAAAIGISVGALLAVIAIIAAVIIVFVILWNKSEAFRNFWKGLWEFLKNLVVGIFNILIAKFVLFWELMKPILFALGDLFAATWELISELALLAWEVIKIVFSPLVSWFNENVIQPLVAAWEWMKDKVVEIFDFLKEKAKAVGEAIASPIKAVAGIFRKGASAVGGVREGLSGGKQFGGTIPKDGVFKLHRGEQVVPSGGTNNQFGNINVTVNAAGGPVNPQAIAQQIMEEIRRRR